jgi:hypothetical protein
MMHSFDYEGIGREGAIPAEKLDELRHLIKKEFPRDEMMCELDLLRACMAIKNGALTIDQALAPSRPEGRLW